MAFSTRVIFAVALPGMILIHEICHYAAARILGMEAHLSYAAVHFTMTRDQYAGWEGLIVSVAGPLINFVLAASPSVANLSSPHPAPGSQNSPHPQTGQPAPLSNG